MTDQYTPTDEEMREQFPDPRDKKWFDRWRDAHDARVRAEQRETDARIAEQMYFGGGNVGSANRWGAKQAGAAIRRQA